ncbi:hypothetical protein DERF_004938 [Dermatophagoides farinae]|uniref:Uncharacterized protein n=1 Tax=Dermatophagoides farinae TaxID=6954 RepID=A0A922I3C3_DERFA|nr:hypothetical protein DERF_004938 [Dermatophagoides farinae]
MKVLLRNVLFERNEEKTAGHVNNEYFPATISQIHVESALRNATKHRMLRFLLTSRPNWPKSLRHQK